MYILKNNMKAEKEIKDIVVTWKQGIVKDLNRKKMLCDI